MEEVIEQPVEAEVTEKPKPAQQLAAGRSPIAAQETGVLRGTSFEDQYRLAKAYSASGLMPKSLNTPEKVLVALQLCYELNIPPMSSIGKICVINGTPSLFGELPLALVMRSGLLESVREYDFDKDGKELPLAYDPTKLAGAATVVQRKGYHPSIASFTVEQAKKAGLWGKSGPWTLYPNRMLQMRARNIALKNIFPDVLLGLSIMEYDHNLTIDTVNTEVHSEGAVKDIASELNQTFLPKVDSGQPAGNPE